jgi:hypothetical protein
MCFNPVADGWWEKKPRIVDFAAYKPRKGGGAGAYAFCGARPALEESRTAGKKSRSVFISFMHCRLSERPANLNTKYKNKGRNSNQSLPVAGPKVTRDCYSPSGLATIWP